MSGSAHTPASPATGSRVSPVLDESNDYNFDLTLLQPPPSFTEKLWQKTKQDPLVPIGFAATCAALTGGIISMARARSEASQRFMQLRVGAQAFTLGAVVFALYSSQKSKQQAAAAAEAEAATPPNTAATPSEPSSPTATVPSSSPSAAADGK